MIVAAIPIDPPEDHKYWAFHVINDAPDPIESIVVESVDFEWGDVGSSTAIGTRVGPVAPGKSIEIWRESETEVKTAVTLVVHDPSGPQRIMAEFGKLYSRPGALVTIPVLNRPGKRATIEPLDPAPGSEKKGKCRHLN